VDAGTLRTLSVDIHQTVDNDASAKGRIDNFINKVTCKRASPLIRELPKELPAKAVLPQRNKHQAAQSLSRMRASKRGEILVMQRLDLIAGSSTPSSSATKAYEDDLRI
jgi:hypothetical protein